MGMRAPLRDNAGMPTEVFLEPVPDADISIAQCSLCKEQFHSSPVGPRQPMSDFWKHVEEQHPDAVFVPRSRIWKKDTR